MTPFGLLLALESAVLSSAWWVPAVIVAYALGRRALTTKAVIVFAFSEVIALALVYAVMLAERGAP
jgi:hypothetical protein